MTRRKGLIAWVRQPVDEMPPPNRHIPAITVDCRVYFPPNATEDQVFDAIEQAITDICDQVHAEALPSVVVPTDWRDRVDEVGQLREPGS